MPMNLGLGLGLSRRIGAGGGGGSFVTSYTVGFEPNADAGTAGDLFVATTGNDSNDGSFATPKRTISNALAAASAGQTIRVRAGTYRERVVMAGKGGVSPTVRTRIMGYGTEKPLVTAGEPLTGFVQCTVADAPVLGPINPANVWKVTGIAKSSIASSNGLAANIHEAGVKLPICRSRPDLFNPQPQLLNDNDMWIRSINTITSGGNIVSWQLPAGAAPFGYDDLTSAQVLRCQIRYHTAPNVNDVTTPSSYTAATRTLVPTASAIEYETNSNRDTLCLTNLLPRMERGSWGFVDNGSTVDFYVWPNDVANLTSGMEYAARANIFDTNGVSNIEISHMELAMASSASVVELDGGHAISAHNPGTLSHHRYQNLLIRGTERSGQGYGPIELRDVDNIEIDRVTIKDAIGQFGMFVRGTIGNEVPDVIPNPTNIGAGWNPIENLLITRTLVDTSESAAFRVFVARNGVVAFCETRQCGLAAHANKINFYEQCHNMLVYGCNFAGADGYATWQEASDICFVANNLSMHYNPGEGRTLNDQNNTLPGSPSPATPGKYPPSMFSAAHRPTVNGSIILNNRLTPYDLSLSEQDSLILGNVDADVSFTVHNNITHGVTGTVLSRITAWDRNIQTNGAAIGGGFGVNDIITTASGMYTDVETGDFSYKPGAAIRTATPQNVSSIITALQSRFPLFTEWDKGVGQQPINWANPFFGPVQNYDQTLLSPIQRIRWPSVTGTLVVGFTVGSDPGWIEASPFPSFAYQWQTSPDGVTWTDIAGATGATYVPVSGDIGQRIRQRITAGNDVAFAVGATPILASYPIATPTQLAYLEQTSGSATSKNLETPAFSTNGRPILVVASQRNSSNADATLTVTLGTAGRAFGTGTTVPFVFRGRGTSNESQVLILLAPGTATNQTIQVQSSLTTFGTQVAVFEVQGLTGAGATGSGGVSVVSTITSALTTLNPNSAVLHIFNRFSGDIVADPVTLSGATLLVNDNTGGVSVSADLAITIGFELAPVLASYGATTTWTTGRTTRWTAVELRS